MPPNKCHIISNSRDIFWFGIKKVFFYFDNLISTKGALRLPTTYDNHPSNPIPSIYSCEDDLSIEDLI